MIAGPPSGLRFRSKDEPYVGIASVDIEHVTRARIERDHLHDDARCVGGVSLDFFHDLAAAALILNAPPSRFDARRDFRRHIGARDDGVEREAGDFEFFSLAPRDETVARRIGFWASISRRGIGEE